MLIQFTEPTAPRYIYINPANNLLHLLVPLVKGKAIATDNIYKSIDAPDEFFQQEAARRELTTYREALEFDLQLLDDDHPLKAPKQQRLTQINAYIQALPALQATYAAAILSLLKIPSNLYSIQLRPQHQDPHAGVISPVFSINRYNDETGRPLSALYNAMHTAFSNLTIATCDPQMHPTTPFNNLLNNPDKTEKLSMLTQFFLAHINIYCAKNGICHHDFGAILDASPPLSHELTSRVAQALSTGAAVEESTCTFFNEHAVEFGLTQPLKPADVDRIKQTFQRSYATVMAIADNQPMDAFVILDTTSRVGKFVTHQGSICTDFTELLIPQESRGWKQFLTPILRLFYPLQDSNYFQTIRSDFEAPHDNVIPDNNKHIQGGIDVDSEALMKRIKDDEQFNKLPIKIRQECLKDPAWQLRIFLHDVAKGKQDRAEKLLTKNPGAQILLSSKGTFTDYSGRTFNCTAYEYAYWAKDTPMRRMLEAHMDKATKATLLERIEAIERKGLTYEQQGVIITNPGCFKFNALKKALHHYIDGYDAWVAVGKWNKIKTTWMQVGLAQRDLPVHVINEYCRPDRSFDPTPAFDEKKLPRETTYYNFNVSKAVDLLPLVISDTAGLGVDFALGRADFERGAVAGRGYRSARAALCGLLPGPGVQRASLDLMAISHLDKVRTDDLKQSLEILGKPKDPKPA